MNIYHVSQDENNAYDTFSDFVVVAKDAKTARNTNPYGQPIDWRRIKKAKPKYEKYLYGDEDEDCEYCEDCEYYSDRVRSWAENAKSIKVKYIGKAIGYRETTIICASFHAG